MFEYEKYLKVVGPGSRGIAVNNPMETLVSVLFRCFSAEGEKVDFSAEGLTGILVNKRFRHAWVHHYTNNPHHHEYWANPDGSFKSTFNERKPYLVEMVCDWIAMGMAQGGTARDWYSTKKNKIRLAAEDRQFVESLLACEAKAIG
jgi:hypothetical protein